MFTSVYWISACQEIYHGARFRRAVSDLCVLEPVRSLSPLFDEDFSRDIWLTAADLDGAA